MLVAQRRATETAARARTQSARSASWPPARDESRPSGRLNGRLVSLTTIQSVRPPVKVKASGVRRSAFRVRRSVFRVPRSRDAALACLRARLRRKRAAKWALVCALALHLVGAANRQLSRPLAAAIVPISRVHHSGPGARCAQSEPRRAPASCSRAARAEPGSNYRPFESLTTAISRRTS